MKAFWIATNLSYLDFIKVSISLSRVSRLTGKTFFFFPFATLTPFLATFFPVRPLYPLTTPLLATLPPRILPRDPLLFWRRGLEEDLVQNAYLMIVILTSNWPDLQLQIIPGSLQFRSGHNILRGGHLDFHGPPI